MKRKLDDTELSEYEITKIPKTEGVEKATGSREDVTNGDLRGIINDFLAIYESLDTLDIPDRKPNYSYTELVYLAILTSPNFCLTTPEIYKHVQKKFLYFRTDTNSHWKNAVRHSLSKTKCFRKIQVGKRIGRGIYNRSTFLWSIHPHTMVAFARGDYRPCASKNALRLGFYKINSEDFWQNVAYFLKCKMQSFQTTLTLSPDPMTLAKQQSCTVPVSHTGSSSIGGNGHLSADSDSRVQELSSTSSLLEKIPMSEPVTLNQATDATTGGSRLPEYDASVNLDRLSPVSCASDSGFSSFSSLKDSDTSRDITGYSTACYTSQDITDDSGACLGLNISSLLGDDTMVELSDTSGPLYLDLPCNGERYDFLFNPSLSAADYVNSGVAATLPVMCHELSTLENLSFGCYCNLFCPSNPYVGYGGYSGGYW